MSIPTASSLRLAEILATRLCHDLASPLGTIAGLIELAEETGDGAVLRQAHDAATLLGDRLRLLRAAWSADPGPLAPAALVDLAKGLFGGGRVSLDAAALRPHTDFSPAAGRLVLNLLLLGAEALSGAGTLHLAGVADQDLVLRIAGPRRVASWHGGLPAGPGQRLGLLGGPAHDADATDRTAGG